MIPSAIISVVLILAPVVAAIPDEALWSPLLYALALIAGVISLITAAKSEDASSRAIRAPALLMGLFVVITTVSMLYHWLGVHHGHPRFLDAMLRQTGAYLALVVLLATLSRTTTNRLQSYVPTIGLLIGTTIASIIGLQDFLGHLAIGDRTWREFATSTPDYFAALLIMTIPITSALFIGAMSNKSRAGMSIYGASLLIQLPVLAATGSRFALASLAIGLIGLAYGLWIAARSGAALPKVSRKTMAGIVIVLLLVGAVGAKSVIGRLFGPAAKAQTNSAMFRVYTWKGAIRLADAHPLIGTGPGTFVYAYQKHAIVGYTRVAHNSYIQAITDTGYPAVILLTAGLIWCLVSGFRAISRWPDTPETASAPESAGRKKRQAVDAKPVASVGSQFLDLFAATDDRILNAGLAAGFAAGLVQNLIDSDWYITFDALALWAIGGLLLAHARRALVGPASDSAARQRRAGQATAIFGMALYAVAAIGLIAIACAQKYADDANAAVTAGDPAGALDRYQAAIAINPTRGKYYSDLGMLVYPRMDDPTHAESALKQAIAVEPNATNYRRLGKLYLSENRPGDALKAFVTATEREPNDLDLYLLSAQARRAVGDTAGALDDDRLLAAKATEPLGRYPAIGDIVEIRFAEADVPLGNDELAHGHFQGAIRYYGRARTLVERYLDEGGSMNAMRQMMEGGRPDPEYDTNLQVLYDDAMKGLELSYRSTGQTDLAARMATEMATGDTSFQSIITQARKATGE